MTEQNSSQPYFPGHWEDVLTQEFERESDRASVILAAALLDSALEILLKARLVPSATANDSLMDGAYAPVSNYSARIDLAYRMGLISAKFARDLHLVRKIRNNFAHNISGASFEDSGVRSRVQELRRSCVFFDKHPWLRDQFPNTPRGDFQMAASWMQFHLHQYIAEISSIEEAGTEWGYNSELELDEADLIDDSTSRSSLEQG